MEDKTQEAAKAVALGEFNPHVVHHRDPLTHMVVKSNAYRLHIVKGVRYFEWPRVSGNLYYENREYAGRLNDNGDVILDAEFVPYVPPQTIDESVGEYNVQLEQELARVKAELAAIKSEEAIDKAVADKQAGPAVKRTAATVEEKKVDKAEGKSKAQATKK